MADSTIRDLDQLYKQARTSRSRLEPDWFLNLSFFNNRQWVAWAGGQLHKPQLRRDRITLVDNRITGMVRTEIAKLTKNHPVFTVTPRSSDEEDANASELAEQVMRYLWKHLNLDEIAMKALEWSRICGAGFLKCFWDSTIGESTEVLVGSSGNILTDAQGAPMRPGQVDPAGLALSMGMPAESVRVKKVSQGDLRVEARSPFQMFIDPLADSFSEAEWLIEESVKSKEYVQRRYQVELTPDTPANPGLVEARMSGTGGLPGGTYKGIKIREYWCKPNSEHPNGCRVVWASTGGQSATGTQDSKPGSGQILVTDNSPFDSMPYIMLSGIPTPGRLWPMSIVEMLRGPQTELNKIKSQIAENRNRVGNPTLVASKQAVQNAEQFEQATTKPGGVYYFDDIGSPNAVPKYLDAPILPPYVIEEIQRIEEAFADISGQHEVTSAQVPPGVTAASAINLLQEADDTRLGPAIRDYELQLGRLGQKLLGLVANYYTDARTIRLSGENGSWEIFDFRGAMLKDNTQIEVQAGSAFPQSKAAKQAAMQDLLTFFVQSGNLPHGRQLAQFLKDWEVGGADRLIQEYTTDETQVNRENQKLSQGQSLPVNEYDNDQAHIDAHTDFQKQSKYQNLQPQIQQVFEQHVSEHRQRLAEQQQQQMQLQMQMQGTPPPGQQQAQQQLDLSGQAQQHGLDAAQAHQQMQLKGLQSSQQQGLSQAQSEQQQRQAEELHHQKLRHQDELHQLRLRQQNQSRQPARSNSR